MSFNSCNPAHLFIDLATFSEIEGFLYGGPEAMTWFVAAIQKANWAAHIPVVLRNNGILNFGAKNVTSSINRSGDYVLSIWFRAQIPQIELVQPYIQGQNAGIFVDATVRWTRNLMHNLFEKVSISFNELVVEEMDNYWLDFNFQFRCPGAKRVGYRNMIGDIAAMTTPVGPGVALGTGGFFSVPFPFWFGEDSGIALPVAALPFNDIKVNYTFRKFEDLIVVYPGTAAVGGPGGANTGRTATANDVSVYNQTGTKPSLLSPETRAEYAVVHNDERVKMGDAPRDILMRQVQTIQNAPFKDLSSRSTFDIRLSHSIILFCFAAQNVTLLEGNSGAGGEWSNYTTETNYTGLDPLSFATLVYENTCRLAEGSDFYSLMCPYLFSDAIPDESGYHFFSYALHPWDPLKPSFSTNYSKLANVSMTYDISPAAQAAGGVNGAPTDQNGNVIQYPDSSGVLQNQNQRFRHIFEAMNWNIVRVANGSLGHPTL